jgi:hypothetical protein
MAFFRLARRLRTDEPDDPVLPSAIDAAVLCTIFVICTTTVFSFRNGRASQSMTDHMRAACAMRSHKQCLEAVLLCQDPCYKDRCALLWALYVGAAWETRVELTGKGEIEWQPWYQAHLSVKVAEMGISDWNCFIVIVESFCRMESVSNAATKIGDIICAGFDIDDGARDSGRASVTSEMERLLFPWTDSVKPEPTHASTIRCGQPD